MSYFNINLTEKYFEPNYFRHGEKKMKFTEKQRFSELDENLILHPN